jgi:DUF1365 family protein
MHSCIYEGRVTHHRYSPVDHAFQYRLFMVFLDLAEVPALQERPRVISPRRFAGASFLRDDHLKQTSGSLGEAVRAIAEQETGVRPKGPIRLLTQLRYFGCYFSPLNLYYCYDAAGDAVEVVVAEVSNTPWLEQHCYVLWEGNRASSTSGRRYVHEKTFHVSPFMDMDVDYRWRLADPSDVLKVHVTNTRAGDAFFRAGMSLKRRPLTRSQLFRSTVRYPFMTAQIVLGIYYQALRLWMKKCPYYPHPNKSTASPTLPA